MSARAGPGRPPVGSRFRKGESGNPRGRPKSRPASPPSAFDIIIDKLLTVTQNGTERELSVEEALQHKTYQDAIAGNRTAEKEVLKMIAKREKWLAAHRRKPPPIDITFEHEDPENANEALLVLGIAEHEPLWKELGEERLALLPWAVQAALSRAGARRYSRQDIEAIERLTLDSKTLRWPASSRDG
jgi:hypothetical protein